MSDKVCCLFEAKSAKAALKDWRSKAQEILEDDYRERRFIFRCDRCGALVLYDYEETAHYVPGEDWDNAYVDEYYYPLLDEDIRREGSEISFNWKAISSRRYIEAHYRELDSGETPYYYAEPSAPEQKAERQDFSKEGPVRLAFHQLPAEAGDLSGLRNFTELMQLDASRGLVIELPGYDDPEEIRVEYREGGYYLEMSFPMHDFGWEHPLVLANDGFACKDVLEVLNGVLQEGKSTEEIPAAMKLKDITNTVYGGEKE